MADKIVFSSTSETEAEPDPNGNDADPNEDAGFSASPPQGDIAPGVNGADPVAVDHLPSTAEAGQIAQLIADDDGVSKSFVQVPTANGGEEILMSDANGNLTHDVIINPDGSTDDETYGSDGSHSSDTVGDSTSDPRLVSAEGDNFDNKGDETSTSINNEDTTSAETHFATNPDGSESVDGVKEFNLFKDEPIEPINGLPDGVVPGFVKDAIDYAAEHVGDIAKEAKNSAWGAVGTNVVNGLGFLEKLSDSVQFTDLVVKAYTEGPNVTNVSEVVAKAAEIALPIIGEAAGVSPAITSAGYHATLVYANAFANLIVDGALAIHNTLIVQPQIDAIESKLQKITVHPKESNFQLQSVPVSTLPSAVQTALAAVKQPANPFPNSTNDPIGQQTIISWQGSDVSGFADAANPWPGVGIQDASKNTTSISTVTPYTGPVAGLQNEFIAITPDNLNLIPQSPNMFIHSGSGNDAIDATTFNGNNTIDGSTGSNFLVGGSGLDTFFVDDRGPTQDIWTTIKGFHSGDNATIWGLTPADFNIAKLDNQGAPGATGLTFSITASGKPNANLTLSGFTTADLSNGRLAVSFGRTPDTPGLAGSDFMLVHGV